MNSFDPPGDPTFEPPQPVTEPNPANDPPPDMPGDPTQSPDDGLTSAHSHYCTAAGMRPWQGRPADLATTYLVLFNSYARLSLLPVQDAKLLIRQIGYDPVAQGSERA